MMVLKFRLSTVLLLKIETLRLSKANEQIHSPFAEGSIMFVGYENDIEAKKIDSPEVKNAKMKVLISPAEGWSDHVMRVIELGKDGYSPKHVHPWPHINYILDGKGILHIDGTDYVVSKGSVAFVPPETLHQFKNIGDDSFRFICIVPKEGHQ
jgi:quercetin dioxygenase-like cupin family protein